MKSANLEQEKQFLIREKYNDPLAKETARRNAREDLFGPRNFQRNGNFRTFGVPTCWTCGIQGHIYQNYRKDHNAKRSHYNVDLHNRFRGQEVLTKSQMRKRKKREN